MQVEEEKKDQATILSLSGRLDSATSPDVNKLIIAAIEEGAKHVILDFAKLDYLSSAGIRVLVHCSKVLEKKEGKILLASVPKPIENVLYITGFLPYFKLFEDSNRALKSLEAK